MTFKIKKKLLYQNKSRTLGLNISVIKQSINMINFRSITNIYTVQYQYTNSHIMLYTKKNFKDI